MAALDADGGLRWESRGGLGTAPGALAVAPDGTAVFGLAGGEAPLLVARGADGAERWRIPLTGRAVKVAVAPDGTAVVALDRASARGGAALVAIAPDGAERWRVETGLTPPAGLAIGADGTAYAVVTRGLLRGGGTLVRGTLTAIAADGTARWRVEGPLAAADPLVGGGGTVYAGGSPLRALRPDGTPAWTWPSSRPLIPRAIGPEGTLYVTAGILERAYAAPGGTVLALAGPGAPRSVTLPDARRQRTLIAGLRVRPASFRTAGPVAFCAAPGRCRPAAPLGATIAFRLRREATVSLLVRRVGDGRPMARLDRRVLPGTTWRSVAGAAIPRDPGGAAPRALRAHRAGGGRRPARDGGARPVHGGGAVSIPFRHIACRVDDSDAARRALALGREPAEPGLMARPPRPAREGVVTREVLLRAWLLMGTVSAPLVMGGLLAVRPRAGWRPRRRRRAALVAVPGLQGTFHTTMPSAVSLLPLLAFPLVVWGVDEAWRASRRRRDA